MHYPLRTTEWPCRLVVFSLVGTFVWVSGCTTSNDASTTTSTSAGTQSASTKPSALPVGGLSHDRTLALAPPRGNAAVDQLITAQQKATQLAATSDIWIILGRSWIRKARETNDPGYYLHADACANIVLDKNPDDILAQGLKAQVLLNQHQFAEASDTAERLLSKKSDDLTALAVLSDSALERGRFDLAADAAQRMIDLKPGLPAYIRVSYLRWLKGDSIGAKQAARSAIDASRDPKDPEPAAWAYVQAAHIFWFEGNLKEAESGYDKALQLVNEYPAALVGKARVQLAKGNTQDAISLLENAIKQSPLAETAWLLGDAHGAAGDREQADHAYEKVIQIGLSSDQRTLAAYLANKNRDLPLALQAIESEKKHRDDIYTNDAHAWVLYRLRRTQEAKVAIEKACSLGTPDPTLLYHRGAILIASGDTKSGKRNIEQALALNPKFDSTAASEAANLLKSLSSK